MTNEIKEILDNLRKTADNTIFAVCSTQEELDKMPRYTANFMSINDRKAKVLLDYITDLQEENKRLKEDYAKIVSSNCDYLKLEQENERLNKIIDEIEKVINECSILGEYGTSRMFIEKDYLLNKIKELKEEGKKDE